MWETVNQTILMHRAHNTGRQFSNSVISCIYMWIVFVDSTRCRWQKIHESQLVAVLAWDRILVSSRLYVLSSVAQSCQTLCDCIHCSTPGLPVHHQVPEFTQTHIHWVSDGMQPSHPLSSPFPPAFNLSHHFLFQWISSSYQAAKGSEFQLQHQSFQWTPRTDLL